MPLGNDPGTHASGLLTLFYGAADEQHEASIWQMEPIGGDAPAVRAGAFAAIVGPIIDARYTIAQYAWTPTGQVRGIPTPLGAPVVGTSPGSNASKSWTWTVSGLGIPVTSGDVKGRAKLIITLGNDSGFTAGVKYLSGALVPRLQDLIDWLNDGANEVSNSYGQDTHFYARASVQFNSRLQQKRGS